MLTVLWHLKLCKSLDALARCGGTHSRLLHFQSIMCQSRLMSCN